MHSHNIEIQAHQTPNKLYKEKQRNLIYTILIRLSLAFMGSLKHNNWPYKPSLTRFEQKSVRGSHETE